MLHQRINADWNEPCVVVATGPSLTHEVAQRARFLRWFDGWRLVLVNDAYRMLPIADVLYACDERWWNAHNGVPKFTGERWSSHSESPQWRDDKRACAERYGLNLVPATDGEGFSRDARQIHYCGMSGGQAINLAILKGSRYIVLVGFDMKCTGGKSHFFGDHPSQLVTMRDNDFSGALMDFKWAAQSLPEDVTVINATPGSALTSFPMMGLDDAVRAAVWRNDNVYRDRAVTDSATDQQCTA